MKFRFLFITLLAIGIVSCTGSDSDIEFDSANTSSNIMEKFTTTAKVTLDLNKKASKGEFNEMDFMTSVNSALLGANVPLQLAVIEAYSVEGERNTVLFNDRGNKQLGHDFVPNDPERGTGENIIYVVDQIEGMTTSGLTQGETNDAIMNAMSTWNNVSCSAGVNILEDGPYAGFDFGYVQFLVGQGGFPGFVDLMHSGWNDVIKTLYGPESGVLGVTFTFIWTDEITGEPTDMDNNRKNDVAFRDIYYNNEFAWAVDGQNHIDVETVALHEAGHGLSQAHFGKLFQGNANEKYHFAPRAVMNAGYTGVQRTIGATDRAGHCSNWGQWPNN